MPPIKARAIKLDMRGLGIVNETASHSIYEALKTVRILLIKISNRGAVNIEYRMHVSLFVPNGQDQFAPTLGTANDVPGVIIDIGNHHRFVPHPSFCAYALPFEQARTSDRALKGAQHQFAMDYAVKTHPMPTKRHTHHGHEIGLVRHRVRI